MNNVKILELFEKQLALLIKVHREGRTESIKELDGFGNVLANFDDSFLGDAEKSVLEDVKKMFATSVSKLKVQFDADVEFLEDQKAAIDVVNKVQDDKKREELIQLLVEDFGEVESDFSAFKKQLEAQAAEDRQFLQNIIQDLTNMLQEGGFKEIEAVLAEFADVSDEDDEDEVLLPDGDLSDEDLEAVRDAFEKINRPYLNNGDEQDDSDLN